MSLPLSGRLARVGLPLRTERLLLYAPSASRDLELVELLEDPGVARWTTIPRPYTRRDAAEFRRRAAASRRKGTDLALQIVLRADGRLVGGVGLHGLNPRRLRGELGYWVGRPFRRQGYAVEASRRLLRLGFAELGLHRIEAHVFPGNVGSTKVLRSLGFSREGRLRQSFRHPSLGWRDELLYGRLEDGFVRSAGERPVRSRSSSPGRTR